MMTRLTVDLSDRAEEIVSRLASDQGTTKVEVLRRALALYDYVQEQTSEGSKLALVGDGGDVKERIVFPG